MNNWSLTTLGEIADGPQGFVDGPFGSNLPASDYTEFGIPVIRGSNLSLGIQRFKGEEFVFVSNETANRLQRSQAQANDIIVTKKGTIGQTGLVPENSEFSAFVLSSNQMRLRVDINKADPLFVYYYISSALSVAKIIQDSEATGVPKTNLLYFRTFPILLPPLNEQQIISSILGALDDKIELNRRMHETLEAMAQAIFRDWFVDFGPTRRKLSGLTDPIEIMGGLVQDSTRAAELAALFPDAIGVNGLPEGWNEKSVEDTLTLSYGKSLTKSVRQLGDVPVYGSGGVNGTHNTALVQGPGIIVGRKGTVGSLYWEDQDFFPIDTVFYVEPKQPLIFCYYLLQTLGLDGMNTDAAVPGLNRSNVYRLAVPYSEETAGAYSDLTTSIRDRISHNERENQTLAATRDLLLPKLMSGETRLRDAEAIAEAAT